MKKGACLALALALCLAVAGSALAQTYSFVGEGVRLRAENSWTVLTPQTLEARADMLSRLGADIAVLRADYAANHTLLEAYLPQGAQVALAAVQTEQSAAWQDVAYMSEADKAAFAQGFARAPYENAGWAQGLPGYYQYEWALQASGTPVAFAGLATVAQGTLYTLVASGAADVAALHAANREVAARMEYTGMGTQVGEAPAAPDAPADVADDGVVTPLAMKDFSTVTYEDATVLALQTLPGADVTLRTASDTLRGRADEQGVHTFRVSTRRESVYSYTAIAQAQDRKASELQINVERRLSPEDQEASYRKSARQVAVYGYSNLVGAPAQYAGQAVTFRGQVADFTDFEGFPCALVYTDNPSKGVWRNPVWVIVTEPMQLAQGDVYTMYGDIRGDAMAYAQAGESGQAPIVVSRAIEE